MANINNNESSTIFKIAQPSCDDWRRVINLGETLSETHLFAALVCGKRVMDLEPFGGGWLVDAKRCNPDEVIAVPDFAILTNGEISTSVFSVYIPVPAPIATSEPVPARSEPVPAPIATSEPVPARSEPVPAPIATSEPVPARSEPVPEAVPDYEDGSDYAQNFDCGQYDYSYPMPLYNGYDYGNDYSTDVDDQYEYEQDRFDADYSYAVPASPASPTSPADPADYERDAKIRNGSHRKICGHSLTSFKEAPDWWPTASASYETFDWSAFKREILSKFDVEAYLKTEFNSKALDHITLSGKSWKTGLGVGGGAFELVCYKMFGSTETREHWGQVLRAAAKFAGVAFPDFRKLGCTYYDVLRIALKEADNVYLIGLEDGQKLSHVLSYNDMDFKVNHVIAPCGVGKTYATDFVYSKSMYVPMTRQAESFAEAASARGVESVAVVEGYGHDGENSIFGTYDASSKEMDAIYDGKMRVEGRTAFIDEVQHLNHDTFRNGTAIRPLLKIAKHYVENGARVVTLTGTPSAAYPQPIGYAGSDVYIIYKLNEAPKSAATFTTSDPTEAISAIKDDFTHITYSIDDRMKCEATSEALTEKDIKSRPLHSKNKNKDFAKYYTGLNGEDGLWEKGIRAYVTTRATVDGFSVRIGDGDGNEVKVAEMFDSSVQFGSQMIYQRAKRIRDHEAKILVGLTDKAALKIGQGGHFDFEDRVEDERKTGQIMLNAANALFSSQLETIEKKGLNGAPAGTIEADKAARDYVMKQFKGWVVFGEDGEIEVDDLAIIQRITAEWVAASHANPDIMINELESYGYVFDKPETQEEEKKKEAKILNLKGDVVAAEDRKSAVKAAKKAKKETELADLKEQAAVMSIERARAVVKEPSKAIKENKESGVSEVAAAFHVTELVEKGVTVNEAKRQIENLTSTSKRNFKRIDSKIQLAKIRRAMGDCGCEFDDPRTKFLATLQNGETFKIGEALTTSEITKRVSDVASACGIPEIMVPLKNRKKKKGDNEHYDNDRKIIQLVNDMYEIRRTKRKIGDQMVRVNEVLNVIEIELSYVKQ